MSFLSWFRGQSGVKEPESADEEDDGDAVKTILAAISGLGDRLDTLEKAVQALDRRHYRGKAQGNGGSEGVIDPRFDFSWFNRPPEGVE